MIHRAPSPMARKPELHCEVGPRRSSVHGSAVKFIICSIKDCWTHRLKRYCGDRKFLPPPASKYLAFENPSSSVDNPPFRRQKRTPASQQSSVVHHEDPHYPPPPHGCLRFHLHLPFIKPTVTIQINSLLIDVNYAALYQGPERLPDAK